MTAATASVATLAEVGQLLHREARLLDDRRYEEWLELFTEDGLYWVPVRYEESTEAGAEGDVRDSINLIYDDAGRRSERVWRTLHTPVLDQKPPSRTIRLVSNIEVDTEPGTGGATRVHSCQLVNEMRPGARGQSGLNEVKQFPARVEHHLRRVDGRWLIALKKVRLMQADQPIYGLTFLV